MICAPILNTIKGHKCKFFWTSEANEAFELLKKKVAQQPVLTFPNFSKVFQIECDASIIVIEGVLSQEGIPIAFFSEKLNEAKHKYYSYDLEMYALVQSLKKWRHYLLPKEFIVYTDKQALSFINSQEKLNHRQMKWVETLQAFTFSIMHKKGVANKVADALSRRTLTMSQIQLETTRIANLKDMYDNDVDFKEIYKSCTNLGDWYNREYVDFLIQEGLLFKGGKICIP